MPADILLRNWDGLLWLLVFLGPLLFFQRQLHFELQAIFLLITRNENAALLIFSLLFLPGVLLHESSHYLVARLLGVRTGRFSLLPQILPNGRLQLGFVETAPADVLRDGLIGAAPLVTGGLVMAYLGAYRLGLLPLAGLFAANDWHGLMSTLASLPEQPDFWLWFYLAFAVSTTMLPSASDRRAWLPILLVVAFLLVLVTIAGGGPWMLQNAAPWLNRGLRAAAAVFGISLAIHVVLWLPSRLLREVISRVTHTAIRLR